MSDQLSRRDRYLRYACLLLIGGIGLRTLYAGAFESSQVQNTPHWMMLWVTGFACFLAAYVLASRSEMPRHRQTFVALLAVQGAVAVFLVWLYPSFITICLLVVVAWQIGWSAPLRVALWAALAQSAALAIMKCAGETGSLSILILLISCGFQVFAISAAHLARSEAAAHDELARVNAELRATQALMTESARMTERLRISRDLHDILGHSLTTLMIHLDVASRLTRGQEAEHVKCARDVAHHAHDPPGRGQSLDERARSRARQVRAGCRQCSSRAGAQCGELCTGRAD